MIGFLSTDTRKSVIVAIAALDANRAAEQTIDTKKNTKRSCVSLLPVLLIRL
ncbi:hypothetical protein GPAL_1587 [Glaciecola pallidula DSM 14239 = ACAM 615]|uniref:Uncharacterized protein n=1 Tax=Brumicola pallidula DSM 14239 = ACAM 615 TaxID=1121922 RepID=K6YWV3_9ALTE|nr:hypothetical protein GPAL_1587 [Glaciecola pallidula DSM 14239 = ACAM 615]